MGGWGRMEIPTPQVAATSSFCGGTILSEALHSLQCFPVIFYGCQNAGPEQSDSQDEDALMRSLFHAPLPVWTWREYCTVLGHFTVISSWVRSLQQDPIQWAPVTNIYISGQSMFRTEFIDKLNLKKLATGFSLTKLGLSTGRPFCGSQARTWMVTFIFLYLYFLITANILKFRHNLPSLYITSAYARKWLLKGLSYWILL